MEDMIFYFEEANEDTCKKVNQYQEEYDKAENEFIEQYGLWGQGLENDIDKECLKKGVYRIHTMR